MNQKLDLLLINPCNRLSQFACLSDLATIGPPLGIAQLASFVRKQGYKVAIIDAEALFLTPEETMKEIEAYDPLIVGLTAFTTKMTAAGIILSLVKERMPNVLTTLGGHHSSAIPSNVLETESVDFVIKGEGYYAIVEVIEKIRQKQDYRSVQGVWSLGVDGKVIGNGFAKPVLDLANMPFSAWDLLPMDKYRCHHWQSWDYNLDQKDFAMIYTSLGCPFTCNHCSVNVVYGKNKTRYRDIDHVVAEMKHLVEDYKIKHVEIIDDTFTLNTKRVSLLCDKIIEAKLGDKLNMWCFGRTDTVSKELVEKMNKAGIHWLFMGFESGNDDVLGFLNKKQNVEKIKRANDIVRKTGTFVGGNFIFGLPTDTKDSMQETLDLAIDLNCEYNNLFVPMAYPGTELYNIAKQKNIPLPEKWGQYGFFAPDALPMRNDNLTAEEILTFRDNAFKLLFSSKKYQDMIRSTFGYHIVKFLNEKVLSKDINRIRKTL